MLARFFSIYFFLYVLVTQMLEALLIVPGLEVPELSTTDPVVWLVEWTAAHVFGVAGPLVFTASGSGDKTFDWVLSFCLLVIAGLATAAWAFLSRRGDRDAAWPRWFRVFLRCALGATFFSYGAAKVIPLQMPFPSLTRLLEPYGQFSPMGVLWASIGASRSYEIFTGCAEMTAGILLFIPATQLLGALVSLGCAIQIFTLNMTYDVPVKLFSFHLLAMSLFLIAPEAERLLNVLVLNRPAGSSALVPVGRTVRGRRIATGLQIALGVYLAGTNLYNSSQSWTQYGGGSPRSPLYGIWNVVTMTVDGVERPGVVSDSERWRRVVFDVPARASFQKMDDTFVHFGSKVDMAKKSIALTKQGDAKWAATLAVEKTAPNRMTVRGDIDGKKIELGLELFPREKFLLVARGFNWIQEYPFNR